MLRQAERFTLSLPVELRSAGYRRSAVVQDLSRSGMFVQTEDPLPVGAELLVTIAPEGRRLTTLAHVAHVLRPEEAAPWGRAPGMGLAFRAPIEAADHLFAIGVERLIRDQRSSALEPKLRVIVADGLLRSLEEIAIGLVAAGMEVTMATSGIEVLTACAREVPDLVIVDRLVSVVDGLGVLEAMAREPALASVPVIVMSSDPTDIDQAFARGAADFVLRPVALPELVARARRHALPRTAPPEAAVLRGSLSTLGLPAVLSMLEQEAASGRLEITGVQAGWIELARGVITSAGTTAGDAGLPAVIALLDEPDGTYTLWPGTSRGAARSELAVPVRFALLEHARMRDEASRRASRPGLSGLAVPARAQPRATA